MKTLEDLKKEFSSLVKPENFGETIIEKRILDSRGKSELLSHIVSVIDNYLSIGKPFAEFILSNFEEYLYEYNIYPNLREEENFFCSPKFFEDGKYYKLTGDTNYIFLLDDDSSDISIRNGAENITIKVAGGRPKIKIYSSGNVGIGLYNTAPEVEITNSCGISLTCKLVEASIKIGGSQCVRILQDCSNCKVSYADTSDSEISVINSKLSAVIAASSDIDNISGFSSEINVEAGYRTRAKIYLRDTILSLGASEEAAVDICSRNGSNVSVSAVDRALVNIVGDEGANISVDVNDTAVVKDISNKKIYFSSANFN